ncbi:urease accessory protein UreE [Flavobacterium sp. '19STA2R22 D10 B1']|uniref:urease accessory protein UreE n=1 Tax=Flavobacterium aerium TaxID=3037261 RepID=UPI00278BF5FF|nr:urease accessory protein UreE [Flavobacterium sp. '19STA2R22 D10 B1']
MHLEPIYIDKVSLDDHNPMETLSPDILEIEWYETKKKQFTRITSQGHLLSLSKESNLEWGQGMRLYSNEKHIATISIKPYLGICFYSDSPSLIADFCYYIGNRHLPIYHSNNKGYAVPYDGNLYEQLVRKYENAITLEQTYFLAKNFIRY